MADYDGKIQMALDVSPEDAIKSFKRLQSEAQKLLDSLSTDNLTKSEEKSAAAMSKIVSKGQEAAKQIEKLSKPVETKEYTKLSAEYDKLSAKLETLSQRRDQLVSKGAKDTDPAIRTLDEKLVSVRSRLYDIDTELDKMVAEGKQFTINEEGLERAKNSLVDINNQLAIQNEAVGQTVQGQNESAQRLSEIEQKILAIQQDAGPIDEEFFQVSTALMRVNEELERLYARQAELEQAGRGLGFEEYDANLAKIRELETEQERLNGEIDEYREKVSQAPEAGLTVWERVSELFEQMGQDLAHPIQAMQRLREATDETSGSANNANSAFGKLLTTLGGTAGKFIANVSGINRLSRALSGVSSKATQSSFNFKKLFNTLLKYGIGVRSLFVLYRKIRSAIAENIQYYALMNNGMNQTNRAISAMQSSLNALKGALAGAFVPIITHVAPMLTTLIDNITAAVTAIGMLIARLTGARTYLKAVKKDTNYAAGLSSGGGGKSAQEKYDEAVKKAQEKYDKKVAETEAKNAERMAKAEEKQAKAAAKLAKEQEKANNKLADFDDLNVLGVDTLEELEDVEADLLDMPELEMPNLEDFMGGGGGAGSPFGFEEVPLDGLEWNWDDLLAKCEELGRRLAEMLNDIFADEALAKKIGNAIGNIINMAIAFAYGFVNTFDFHQFGRWIGTLLTEAIDTIRWDVLGTTIGEGLNGLAQTIIGFFETYPAGKIGLAMSTMFNNAVDAIIPEDLGEALADILKDPWIELKQFFTEANMTQAGQKFGRFLIETMNNKVVGNASLGVIIGQGLASIINAGIDFLLGMDVGNVINAFTRTVSDIIKEVMFGIDWPSLGELAQQLIYSFTIGALANALYLVADWLESAIEIINPDWAKALDVDGFKFFLDENFGSWSNFQDMFTEGVKTTANAMTPMEEALESLNGKIVEFSDGEAVNWGNALKDIQAQYQLTDEDMQTVIDLFVAQNEKVQESDEILNGYQGDWVAYKETLRDAPAFIAPTTEQQKLLDDALAKTGDTAKTTKDGVVDYITTAKNQMAEGVQSASEYKDKTVTALQGISDKSDEVVISFDSLTAQLNAELEGLTTSIDTWYQSMITQYFGYDAWYLMLQEGLLQALTDFFTIDLATFLTEQMQVLWDTYILVWFANDKWQAEIYTPWYTFLQTKWKNLLTWWNNVAKEWFKDLSDVKWKNLMKWWDESMKKWWDEKVVPWFKEEKWKEEFMHVYNAAEEVGKKTRDKIKELAKETEDAVHEACDAMIEWIEEVISKLKEAMELARQLAAMEGGGGGSSSSSGNNSSSGGSNSGGGSGGRSFMPMLNIMHFEDNLGMSAFRFPELATGAVIPPNNEFLAILGDQRNGMNIETPLSTMIEAFRSVMDEYMGGSHQSATMEVDGETFARLMMPHIMDEMNRLGYNTEIIEGM